MKYREDNTNFIDEENWGKNSGKAVIEKKTEVALAVYIKEHVMNKEWFI